MTEDQYLSDHSIEDLIRLALVQMDLDEIDFPSALAALHSGRNPLEVFGAI